MTEDDGVLAPGITRDNFHLSRLKLSPHGSTVDCTDLPQAVARYVRDSLAENTRRAYQSDLRHFEGAARSRLPPKPSPPTLQLTPTASA
jgi:hypothetical protein